VRIDNSTFKRVKEFKYLGTTLSNQNSIPEEMGEERVCIGSWWGNRRERDHWGDLGLDRRIILGRISRRWDVGIWTGLGWPRIETGGGRL